MTSTKAPEIAELAERTTRVHALLERTGIDTAAPVPAETVQGLFAAAVRLYAARARANPELASSATTTVTATEAMIATVAMLRAIDLELFDYILWSGRA